MESDSLARQVESVERSITFLRQEQLTLLHGLHLEILSLEKRCTELTCELKSNPPGRSQADVLEEEEMLEGRCREVEGRLAKQHSTLEELQKELSHKGALVGALRASLKDKERSFLEDLKKHSHRTTVLTTELQKQTEAATYLSMQLHSARKKLKHQHQQQQQQHHHHHRQRVAHHDPQEPTGSPSPGPSGVVAKPKRRSGGSKHSATHIRAERARECVPREKVTGPEEPKAMPDPALFFYPHRHRARSRHALRLPLEAMEDMVGAEVPDRVAPILVAPPPTATIAAESKAE
ncbi:coiled-coil domain-containing protein 92 [Alosa alosa]|nr:coiled-coil domain-containing protein 92 [Alosa alosa]XP_048121359.1 coiled-coil domain-containing protein 92 [Alosa alosa]